jgi:Uma2 family endonuclease
VNAQTVKRPIGEFTYKDYLSWPARPRYELIDGTAHAMAPPLISHQQVVFELAGQIRNALEGKSCRGFTGPVGVRLPVQKESDEFIRTVFEPDLVVVCDENKIDAKGIRGAPNFVIEVLSPSTAAFDTIEKRKAYGAAGVQELWLINIPYGIVTRFTQADAFRNGENLYAEGNIDVHLGFALNLDFMKALREVEGQF